MKAFFVYFFYVLKPPQTHEFEFLQSGLIQKTEPLSLPGSPSLSPEALWSWGRGVADSGVTLTWPEALTLYRAAG